MRHRRHKRQIIRSQRFDPKAFKAFLTILAVMLGLAVLAVVIAQSLIEPVQDVFSDYPSIGNVEPRTNSVTVVAPNH